ncbi:hypothetical protein DVQ18_19910 [Yersinia enterocolitica]|nr:hypothetical protein [Yersinia enterocolitica]EKN5135547.1 hypothetical protein [Yersinia enterocolitica]EKN6054890.1 hypothetical protein [Yersinia enterocolitica]EKN6106244.1 hypothetical protein [Yersinia enterocolitica]EKN6153456.1 hypothetical protein [Yersinia enterocolitica]
MLNNKNKVEPWARNSNSLINGHIDNVSAVYHKFTVFAGDTTSRILLFSILSHDIANDTDRMFMLNASLLLGTLHDSFHNIDTLKRLLLEH